jgi:diguanylate cyclase (GGDEF)-like protein
MELTEKHNDETDQYDQPILIGERTWWVGHRLKDDVFQCHVYLIEQGDQSVLLDPGSLLTFPWTLKKIEKIIPFSSIKYFICHHQDPDIAASLPLIDERITRDDAVVITHWRAQALLKHYNLKNLKFWLIDQNDWNLNLTDRKLNFIFTPYAHFPGAFTTFDNKTQILFSSDLFGGFTPEFQLYAEDETYFEKLRPFHEHYIPSHDILEFAIKSIQKYPVVTIAPQHGSILRGDLVPFVMEKLRHLECGIYLFAIENTDIQRLSRLNQTLREITSVMLVYRDFRDIASHLLEIVKKELPAGSMEFFVNSESNGVLHFETETNYTPVVLSEHHTLPEFLGLSRDEWLNYSNESQAESHPYICTESFCVYSSDEGDEKLYLPFFSPESGKADSVGILHLERPVTNHQEVEAVINQIANPLQIALEREVIYQSIDRERKAAYERSIRDPLTGCFTRIYMEDIMKRQCDFQDRHPESNLSAIMVDIDFFKSVNDKYGHLSGDKVLYTVANRIMNSIRNSDVMVRYGGEEFLIILIGESDESALRLAERTRKLIEDQPIPVSADISISVTISAGTGSRVPREQLETFLRRVDGALYRAKNSGRNKVCSDKVIKS